KKRGLPVLIRVKPVSARLRYRPLAMATPAQAPLATQRPWAKVLRAIRKKSGPGESRARKWVLAISKNRVTAVNPGENRSVTRRIGPVLNESARPRRGWALDGV